MADFHISISLFIVHVLHNTRSI